MPCLFEERLELFNKNIITCTDTPNTVLELEERQESGRAKISCSFPGKAIHLKYVDDHVYPYFQSQKCSDHAVIVEQNGNYIAHIFEIKRTITASKWQNEVLLQLEQGIWNTILFTSFLGISSLSFIVHTVYLLDKYRISSEANPSEHHSRSGEPTPKNTWQDSELEFPKIGKILHIKIKEDDNGTANYTV